MPEARDHQSAHFAAIEAQSRDLKRSIRSAIQRQADRWGIRYDQTEALLLDRRAIA